MEVNLPESLNARLMGPWRAIHPAAWGGFHCSSDVSVASSSFFPAYSQAEHSYADLPLEATGSSMLLITYMQSTKVESCTTQCFSKQMWVQAADSLFDCVPKCTHNRSNTVHLLLPKVNYKVLVFCCTTVAMALNIKRYLGHFAWDSYMQ